MNCNTTHYRANSSSVPGDPTESAAETVLYIRPAARLEENRSYAVVVRTLRDDNGDALEPHDGFRALRDDIPTDSPALEKRRAGFEALFTALETYGVTRADLLEAWRFHTASGDSIRGPMLAMRADALARLGAAGLGCQINSVEDDYEGTTYRRVRGTVTAPSYLDAEVTDGRRLRLDDDGVPAFVDNVEVPFTVIIPSSLGAAEGGPRDGPLVIYGHGMLSSGEVEVSLEVVRGASEQLGMVFAATDWTGMSHNDLPIVASMLQDMSNVIAVAERAQQGMVNQLALTRSLGGVCRELAELSAPDGAPFIRAGEVYFSGGSLGGTFGATLLTLSPEIERASLFVGGAVFSFMLERSTVWAPYAPLLEAAYPRRIDRAVLLPLAQSLIDRVDPASYLPFATRGLEDIGPKRFLQIIAVNDAQLTNLSSDMAMRMAGVPLLAGSARTPWGFEVEEDAYDGSGYLVLDLGDPDVPEGNEPPPEDAGGHYRAAFTETSTAMAREFLRPSGRVILPCDGVCDPG